MTLKLIRESTRLFSSTLHLMQLMHRMFIWIMFLVCSFFQKRIQSLKAMAQAGFLQRVLSNLMLNGISIGTLEITELRATLH